MMISRMNFIMLMIATNIVNYLLDVILSKAHEKLVFKHARLPRQANARYRRRIATRRDGRRCRCLFFIYEAHRPRHEMITTAPEMIFTMRRASTSTAQAF